MNLLPEGVLVPHWALMRDSRVIPLSNELWVRSGSAKEYVDRVFSVVRGLEYMSDYDAYGMPEYVAMPYEALERGKIDCEEGSMIVVTLCWIKGVPSFMVIGYANDGLSSHRWPVVLYNGEFTVFDTVTGEIFPYSDCSEHGYIPAFEVGPFFGRPAIPGAPFLPLP